MTVDHDSRWSDSDWLRLRVSQEMDVDTASVQSHMAHLD
jgi:hypothetical protein